MASLIESRRAETRDRLQKLQGLVPNASERIADKACAYVTGSFARGEASAHSDLDLDLDLFIVGLEDEV
jgi:predicted nucleotidyltransferase